MAKYIVTSGSYYRPFSYDEIVKPLQQQTDMQNAMADAYDQLNLETSALKNYISDNPDDRQAKQMYEGYLNKLSTFQNDLYNNGLTASTRRNMSAARSAYASDITRLQKAIQTRQERSKAYWDARHKNPDLVAGFDPGASGLDNYLGDDNYGQNWYSYSGNQFASEVGAEAKARAAELKETAVQRNPQLAGYLEYVEKNGFSNAEVNAAGALAQQMLAGNIRPDDPTIDPVQGMLAGVLISRLQATGANPGQNISPEEFGRLFNYGMLGLSQGVGNRETKLVSDKIWEEQMARNRYAWKQSLKQRLASGTTAGSSGVHRELVNVPMETTGTDKVSKKVSRIFDDKTFENGPVTVNLPGGGSRQIASAEEARDLFHTRGVDKFYESTGIDLRSHSSDFFRTTASKKTGEYQGVPIVVQEAGIGPFGRGTLMVKKKIGDRWVRAADLTEAANRAKSEYDQTMDSFGRANPGLNINSLGATPQDAKKLRKDYDIPEGVPDYDLRTAIQSKAGVGNYYAVPIAVGPEDDDIKERVATNINGIYANAHGKRDWKTSDWGFYQVGKGNVAVDDKNAAMEKAGGLGNVFTVDKSGNIDPKSIHRVYVLSQDIKDGKVKVRLDTTNSHGMKGTFVTDISTLGDDLNTSFTGVRRIGNRSYRMADALEMLMLPFNNTVDVLDRNSGVGEGWEQYAVLFLGDAAPKSSAGGLHYATAAEVARDPGLQKELLDATNRLLLGTVAGGLNPNTLNPRQHVGYTSAKAGDMFGYDEDE